MADTQAIGSALAQRNEVLRDPDEEAELERELEELLHADSNVAATPPPVVASTGGGDGGGDLGRRKIASPSQPEPVTDSSAAAHKSSVPGNEGRDTGGDNRRSTVVPA